ncbi:MAG: hypothetical protein ACOX30_07450 [Dethiobacteria bacterium]
MRRQDYLWLLLLSGSYLLFYLFNRKGKKRKKSARRVDRPLTRREQKAWHELQSSGFSLAEIHPALPVTMTVGGKEKSFNYEGNFLVTRGGKTYLVKVVRGEGPLHWPTLRRELLLDHLFFQTDGIFFYQEQKGQLQEISFSFQGEAGPRERLLRRAALLVISLGALYLGYLILKGVIL